MSDTKWKWNQFSKLANETNLTEYMRREYTHYWYCHYTTLQNVDSILQSGEFWIGNVIRFNDQKDSDQFCTGAIDKKKEDTRQFYSMCFSTGVNENLSLWYLYSGIDGKGARIRMTKTNIKKLVEKGTYQLWNITDNERIVLDTDSMEKTFGDVLYCKMGQDDTEKASLKYNTMTNYSIDTLDVKKYFEKHRGFCKGLVWYYEKETRLLVKLKDTALAQMEPNKEYRVILKIPNEVMKALNIDLAPEIAESEYLEEIKKYKAIEKRLKDTSKVQLSEYSGTIKMNLLQSNRTEIIDNFDIIASGLEMNDAKKICQAMQSKKRCDCEKSEG
jgi:hypothetical protein